MYEECGEGVMVEMHVRVWMWLVETRGVLGFIQSYVDTPMMCMRIFCFCTLHSNNGTPIRAHEE
jgi:hypothetical protein